MAATHVPRMQKALDRINLQIHHVISGISGLTGLEIVDAVLEGERAPKVLADLRDGRIKASEATTMKPMVGDYRREHLFTLRQYLMAYRNYQRSVQPRASVDNRFRVRYSSEVLMYQWFVSHRW